MEKKVTLQELIRRVADRTEGSRGDAEHFLQSLFEVIEENLFVDKIVRIKGIGTFKLVEVNARTSVDINTKERIEIKEHYRVSFTPDNALKDKVNKPFAGFSSVVLDECGVDQGILENTEENPLTEEQLSEYEKSTVSKSPELNVHLEMGGGDLLVPTREKSPEDEPYFDEPSFEGWTNEEPSAEEPSPEDPSVVGLPSEKSSSVETSSVEISAVETSSEKDPIDESPVEEISGESSEEEVPGPIAKALSALKEQAAAEEQETPEEISNENTNTMNPLDEYRDKQGERATKTIMILLVCLLVAALGLLGFFAYKLYLEPNMPVFQKVEVPTDDSIKAPAPAKDVVADSIPETDDGSSIDMEMRAEMVKHELSSMYQQMEGAEYLIVGTADTVQVKPGVSLAKLSRTYFGSDDFVKYIVFYNKIDNPDLLREGRKLLIPLLTKK